MSSEFKKKCPLCGNEQTYTTKYRLNCSIRENWVCPKCSPIHRKKTYSEDNVNNIIELYEQGNSCSKIAQILKLSRRNIKQILVDKDIWVENRDRIKTDFTIEEVKNIVKFYCDERLSCEEISHMFNCSKTPIVSMLKKLELLRDGRSNGKKINLSNEQKNTIKKLYLEGETELYEISRMVGITKSFLDKYLKTCEYRRTKGEAISVRQTGRKRSKEVVEKMSQIQKELANSGTRKQTGGICRKYVVDGIKCYGSFEKYYIEFLIDNGLECPKNADQINTPYGVYYPDFRFTNNLIEIKSDYTYDVLMGVKENKWTKKFDTTQYEKIKWVNDNVIPVKILVVDKKNNKIIEKKCQ